MSNAAEIIAILFLSREQAHRAHLATDSYSQHMALGDFYESIIDIADEFTEVYQGFYGKVQFPYLPLEQGEIDDVLESQLGKIESLRNDLSADQDRPLQNIIDTACAEYARTLYKLRNLK